jgi:hypothetical protein
MYDGGKIIAGLVIGFGLLLSPFFYNAGKAAKSPNPELTPRAKEAQVCVAPTEYMRNQHMNMLDSWRDDAVRRENLYYKSVDGKVYYRSLQETCMDCHSNKVQFCDQCHDYMGVTPYCWDCHIAPKETKPEEIQPKETK